MLRAISQYSQPSSSTPFSATSQTLSCVLHGQQHSAYRAECPQEGQGSWDNMCAYHTMLFPLLRAVVFHISYPESQIANRLLLQLSTHKYNRRPKVPENINIYYIFTVTHTHRFNIIILFFHIEPLCPLNSNCPFSPSKLLTATSTIPLQHTDHF